LHRFASAKRSDWKRVWSEMGMASEFGSFRRNSKQHIHLPCPSAYKGLQFPGIVTTRRLGKLCGVGRLGRRATQTGGFRAPTPLIEGGPATA
jgi:hypothetical protein